ncbi:DNA glycosylase/AP lyase ROS1-like isoform X1 [Apium graveolens]|uniref:DNA glycosylase/AP lyase ROS1-like isoform X1 n=1 Tax=Apium graveolens TaxID=4045 RepID=UPI003D79AE54
MECKELVPWVPFTPQKLCLKAINGKSKCKYSNFIQSYGGLCDEKVEKLGSSSGVEIKFGDEMDESRCTETEERVVECEDATKFLYCAEKLLEQVDFPSVSTPCAAEKQGTRHIDDESKSTEKEELRVGEFEEINYFCAEKLPRNVNSPSVSTPCPAEKQDSRKRHNDGIDLNKKPKQRPKVKKHRPKIAVDRWTPRKHLKIQTAKKLTPKNYKPSTPANVNLRGKIFSGKSSDDKGLTSNSKNVKGEGNLTSTCVAVSCKRSLKFECEAVDKCDGVVESCNRPHRYRQPSQSVEGFSLQVSTELSMCSDFNTESKESGEKCSKRFFYHYQRRKRGVETSLSEENTGINIGTEEGTNSLINTDVNQLMFDAPHEMKKQSVFHQNNLHGNSKAGCLQFYRRTFRVNQCRQNSRKSGPNFPKICKKSRTTRRKQTTLLTIWSVVEGARGGAKIKGARGRCKQITRNFCAQINWKILRKGVRSLRKSKYPRSLSVYRGFQIEIPLLNMIMPSEEQTQAAIADPESFKCVVGLIPVSKSRGKRSKRSVRQIIPNPLLNELSSASYVSKVNEPEAYGELQVVESENYQSWRNKTSGIGNENIVDCDTDMQGGHHMKDTQTQTLDDVQLLKYEKYVECSLNTPSFLLDDINFYRNQRLQPEEYHLDCSLNTPSIFLNDIVAYGNKRLQQDENHLDCSLNTPNVILDNVEAHSNGSIQLESYLDCSSNNSLDVVVYEYENNPPRHKAVRPAQRCEQKTENFTLLSTNYAFVRGLMKIIEKLKRLNIYDECNELVVRDPNFENGTLVNIGPPKKRKVVPKVALDSETLRMFKLMMDNNGSEYSEDTERDKNEWWAKEREVFRGRADSFIARMHLMQGDRRFSKWEGSVVDSVVGVFLTQNVGDNLSSSAFINLAAKYPVKPRSKEISEDVEFIIKQELVGSNARGSDIQVGNKSIDVKDGDTEAVEFEQSCSHAFPFQDLEASMLDMDLNRNNKFDNGEPSNFRKLLELEELDFLKQFYGAENNLSSYNVNMDLKSSTTERSMHTSVSAAPFNLNADPLGLSRGVAQNKSESTGNLELSGSQITTHHNVSKKSKPKKYSRKDEKKKKTGADWEELRKTYCNNIERGKGDVTMDAVDWEAVRNATHREISHVIEKRGMHNVLAARIKDFLERVVKDHGKIDLEWLRDIPPDDAKDFLLSIEGLGLKSVECVRLLTLHHRAFPVDTNVARVAVRLGWVPLAPLPEKLKLHLLESYPLLDKIQIYLFPRLCNLDQETLYQLHYQLITFGKVFCTKINPNCNACPFKGECKHYASSVASSWQALPWPRDKNFVASNMSPEAPDENLPVFVTPLPESVSEVKILDEDNVLDSTYHTQDCQPIIEVPESPRPESVEPQELRDIEDYCTDHDDEIPTIRLNEKELKENLQHILVNEYMFQEGDIADALTALTKVAASVHSRKLKFTEKLKTVHQVFELPDFHPLLEKFEERVIGDSCPYLLAIWPTGVISEPFQHHNSSSCSQELGMNNEVAIYPSTRTNQGETIKGTILIPCRTANRGKFPLNGTYFQVNEVFADFESSKHPIDIPEAWICNLPRRSLHCGSSATAIFRGSIMEEIQYCFWRGYICVRGFDRSQRVTMDLHPRLHISKRKSESRNQKGN